jgi:propionyl-CoA synthetase
LSYNEFHDKVSKFSRILVDQGIKKGDTIIIYMPMIAESVIAMHACARIGAIHSVVFGGFAPEELANRISQSGAKLVMTASCGMEPNKLIPYIPNVDKALQIAGVPHLKRNGQSF